MEEFLVSEMKHTCTLVELIRQARCVILELRRLPPEPQQFHVSMLMAPVASWRLASEPVYQRLGGLGEAQQQA
jgi:hypothetical protein